VKAGLFLACFLCAMARAAPGADPAPDFPYSPFPAAALPTDPLTPDSAFQAGKAFAVDTRRLPEA